MIANLLAGIVTKLGAAGVAAKAGVGLAVAAVSVSGAAAVGVLPGLPSSPSEPVEAVTTVDVSDSGELTEETDELTGDSEEPTEAGHREFGGSVSADASDPDSPGVDGAAVSDAARNLGAQHRPATPGAPADPGGDGLSRAGDTPAAGHLPATVPAGPSTAEQYRPEVPAVGAPADTPSGAPESPTAGPSDEAPAAPETIPAGPPADVPARNR